MQPQLTVQPSGCSCTHPWPGLQLAPSEQVGSTVHWPLQNHWPPLHLQEFPHASEHAAPSLSQLCPAVTGPLHPSHGTSVVVTHPQADDFASHWQIV